MDPESHLPPPSSSAGHRPPSPSATTLFQKLKENLTLKSKWAELNGAMGDLGTYIPIMLAMTLAADLNLGTTLVFTGIYNIVTGAIYGVPMPVQPMKSIAAVAISDPTDFKIPEVMAAGILTAGILIFLGVTGLIKLAYKLIPLPVVRGIQLAQGLSFAMTSVKYIRNVQNLSKSKSGPQRPWLGSDSLLLAIICLCFIIIVSGAGQENNRISEEDDEGQSGHFKRRVGKVLRVIESLPSGFIVFLVGLVLAFVRGKSSEFKGFKFGPSSFHVVKFDRHAWKVGFVKGTLPQLPLSLLNSVIAVCRLSSDLFPTKDVSATSVSISVGVMNMVGCWFGAMPCCHGCGGLAGQYKFGGRSGGCVAILGSAKLVLGFVVGSSLVLILNHYPVGVLGVLLLFAGIELAICARDMNSKEESFVVLICTAVSLVGSSAGLGFICGMIVHAILSVRKMGQGQSFYAIWIHEKPKNILVCPQT